MPRRRSIGSRDTWLVEMPPSAETGLREGVTRLSGRVMRFMSRVSMREEYD